MSGGHYQYAYQHIHQLADKIERELEAALQPERFEQYTGDSENGYLIETLGKNSKARPVFERILKDLQLLAKEAKEVEWLMSGDTGIESFLKRIKEL